MSVLSSENSQNSSGPIESLESNSQLLHQQELKIKEQLKSIPYGEIIKHQQVKKRKKVERKNKGKQQRAEVVVNSAKSSPKEIRIMRKPLKTQPKKIFGDQMSKAIDPRFEDYTGTYKPDLVNKSYSFIRDIQQQEAQHLKKEIRNPKLQEEDRQILLKNYNRVTNDMKKSQLSELEQSVKRKFKSHGFHLKKSRLKEELEKEKMNVLSRQDQDKRLRKKQKKIRKQQTIERKMMQQAINRH